MDTIQRVKNNFLESIQIKTESLEKLAPVIANAASVMASCLLDNHKIGAATRLVIYDLYNDFQEYMNNVDFPNTKIIDQYIHTWVKLLQPFAPFTSEEIWHSLLDKSEFSKLHSEKFCLKIPGLLFGEI